MVDIYVLIECLNCKESYPVKIGHKNENGIHFEITPNGNCIHCEHDNSSIVLYGTLKSFEVDLDDFRLSFSKELELIDQIESVDEYEMEYLKLILKFITEKF